MTKTSVKITSDTSWSWNSNITSFLTKTTVNTHSTSENERECQPPSTPSKIVLTNEYPTRTRRTNAGRHDVLDRKKKFVFYQQQRAKRKQKAMKLLIQRKRGREAKNEEKRDNTLCMDFLYYFLPCNAWCRERILYCVVVVKKNWVRWW